jgi:hypothetical protein
VQQRDAELALEIGHVAAHLRLGQAQPQSRVAEVQLLGDRDERPQLLQVRRYASSVSAGRRADMRTVGLGRGRYGLR